MTAAREAYLFALAHFCHCPPPLVDRLTVTDFGRLTTGIDALEKAREG